MYYFTALNYVSLHKFHTFSVTDIDECADKSICHADAICENKAGGEPTCSCKSGYKGNGKDTCDGRVSQF